MSWNDVTTLPLPVAWLAFTEPPNVALYPAPAITSVLLLFETNGTPIPVEPVRCPFVEVSTFPIPANGFSKTTSFSASRAAPIPVGVTYMLEFCPTHFPSAVRSGTTGENAIVNGSGFSSSFSGSFNKDSSIGLK